MEKTESGSGIVVLYLHGKNQYQSRVALSAALRRAGVGVYRLRVIHGWHGGDALRRLVREEYAAHPKVLRVVERSAGETELVLREY